MLYKNAKTGVVIVLAGSAVDPVWVPLETPQAQPNLEPVEAEQPKKRGRQKKG